MVLEKSVEAPIERGVELEDRSGSALRGSDIEDWGPEREVITAEAQQRIN